MVLVDKLVWETLLWINFYLGSESFLTQSGAVKEGVNSSNDGELESIWKWSPLKRIFLFHSSSALANDCLESYTFSNKSLKSSYKYWNLVLLFLQLVRPNALEMSVHIDPIIPFVGSCPKEIIWNILDTAQKIITSWLALHRKRLHSFV